MDTVQAIFAAFMIADLIATALYVVIHRKKRGAVNKHPHFEPRVTHDRNPGNDGRNYPNATRANGGYNGGGVLPG